MGEKLYAVHLMRLDAFEREPSHFTAIAMVFQAFQKLYGRSPSGDEFGTLAPDAQGEWVIIKMPAEAA
jgi:hypothetical protein